MLDAFAHGKPVIGADSGRIPELVEPNKIGELSHAGDADARRRTIADFWQNRTAWGDLGASARRRNDDRIIFTSFVTGPLLEELYSHAYLVKNQACFQGPFLNIYRYPQWIYGFFGYRGIPNRIRPYEYKDAFEASGWTDVEITPFRQHDDLNRCYSSLSKTYYGKQNQMEYVSIMLCARRSE